MRASVHLVGLVGLALTLLVPQRSSACSCTNYPEFDRAVAQSGAIFLGEVLEIRAAGSQYFESVWVRLRVEGWWKGTPQPEVEILTGAHDGVCGFMFEPGERYLVYALTGTGGFGSPDPSVLSTHSCWRTHMAFPGDPDVAALGPTPVRGASWGGIKILYR